MHWRTLGRTGIEVSEIGYGAWGIGGSQWRGASDDESTAALRRALDLGLNFIDTALAYGDGHSERLIGRTRQHSHRDQGSTQKSPVARASRYRDR
jgi:aryl-alcohol dehydrogenase-like predicted oxidoreductase